MIFDLHPKERLEELVGRENEAELCIRQLMSGNWVAIGGQREVGKTSLMKVVINELRKKGMAGIYLNLMGVKGLNSLLSLLLSEINRGRIWWRFHVKVNFLVTELGLELSGGARATGDSN